MCFELPLLVYWHWQSIASAIQALCHLQFGAHFTLLVTLNLIISISFELEILGHLHSSS